MPTKATAKARKTPARQPASSSGAMTARHVKFPDDQWERGNENAHRDGYTGISDLLRSLLRDYNAGKRMR